MRDHVRRHTAPHVVAWQHDATLHGGWLLPPHRRSGVAMPSPDARHFAPRLGMLAHVRGPTGQRAEGMEQVNIFGRVSNGP
jgi:hypothetical protein